MGFNKTNIPSAGSKFANEVKIDVQYTENILKNKPIGISEGGNPLTNPVTQPASTPVLNGNSFSPLGTYYVAIFSSSIVMYRSSDDTVVTLPNIPSFARSDQQISITWSEDERYVFISSNFAFQSGQTMLCWKQVNGAFTRITLPNVGVGVRGLAYHDGLLYVSYSVTSGNRWVAKEFDTDTDTLAGGQPFTNDLPMPNQPTSTNQGRDISITSDGIYIAFHSADGRVNIFKKGVGNTWTRVYDALQNSQWSDWNGTNEILVLQDSVTPFIKYLYRTGDTFTLKPTQTATPAPSQAGQRIECDGNRVMISVTGNSVVVLSLGADLSQDQIVTVGFTISENVYGATINTTINRLMLTDLNNPTVNLYSLARTATELDTMADARNVAYAALGKTIYSGNTGDTKKVIKFLD